MFEKGAQLGYTSFRQGMFDLVNLNHGLVRLVRHRRRRRQLERRGETLRWSEALQGWLWRPRWCDYCYDGSGGCAYPCYGMAPDHRGPVAAGEWPENFAPDPESQGRAGTYTHCVRCGRGAGTYLAERSHALRGKPLLSGVLNLVDPLKESSDG